MARYWGRELRLFYKKGERIVPRNSGDTVFRGPVLGVLQKRGKERGHSIQGDTKFGYTVFKGPVLGVFTKTGERMVARYAGEHGIRGAAAGIGGSLQYIYFLNRFQYKPFLSIKK